MARNITTEEREAARARLAAHDAAQAAHRFASLPAIAACNACDIEDAHEGCTMGYCSDCCPAH